MRHADHEFAGRPSAALAQDRFERRHQRFGALDAEPLGAGIATVEKPLEGLGGGQDLAGSPFLSAADSTGRRCRFSNFCWIQARSAGTWMCMYSTPIVPQ